MHKLIRKISAFFSHSGATLPDASSLTQPLVLQRDDHNISRSDIEKSALDVLYSLKRAGYDAYLVGGCVRDLLLGLEPKDFDVVTNAEPEQIKQVFRQRCRLIGRRFRLAHVTFGRVVIEVATFRANGEAQPASKKRFLGRKNAQQRQVDDSGRLLQDNLYGTIEEDAWRRDFTVNALYYSIHDFSIADYTHQGLQDIEKGLLRLIGDPETRYREDPVRLIRAVRFAAKLGFKIEPKTEKPIPLLAPLLRDVSNARMFEEVLKLFHSGVALEVFEKLRHYHLFEHLFPQTDALLAQEREQFPRMLVIEALKSTDARIQAGKTVNPSFLFAALLWESMLQRQQALLEQGMTPQDALFHAANQVIEQQISHTAIPKRFTLQIREIWAFQYRLPRRSGDRAQTLVEHPRFRAAYDFLGIRVAAGEETLAELFDWWTQYQEKSPVERVAFVSNLAPKPPQKARRNNRNFYRKRSQTSDKFDQS
ncbi:MAG: polynucleotide adenylyltransferase PcnB [Thiotrichales bacterium]|nr:polynucleotide adenylyltransferase PcnB [Thiotrichales bacterium]